MLQIRIMKYLLQYSSMDLYENGFLRPFAQRRRMRRIERDLKSCYKKYADLNRTIANEWLALDFEGLVKYENIIYEDLYHDFYKFEESRIAESEESAATKSKPKSDV
ncbi:hypothetical protein [Caldicellulosiruptor naganoensis]|uniref:Phage protein n=1 Tax=Caldicellulosiruptor naganoensis TaxID=29324 RepID=A0ABY7BHH4_9FIRM|nr:hypothetical protein [Caldicellulosiruptor naganoensis]WAM32284.1 hypothetical protein OTJ99_000810 [Caldicellulosiruptor naganoensis]